MPRGVERPIRAYIRASKPVEQQLKLLMARSAADLRGDLRGASAARQRILKRRAIRKLYRDAALIIFWGEQQSTEAAVRSMDKHHAVRQPAKTMQDNLIRNSNDRNMRRLVGLLDKNRDNALKLVKNKNIDIADSMNPGKVGGISHTIMRVARAEMNAAFHETSERAATNAQFFNWRLSHTHPTIDVCNEYAARSPWRRGTVPGKPHPFCMCYIEPIR